MDVDACDPLPFLQVKFLLSGLVLLDLIALPLLCVELCCHVSIIVILTNKSQYFFWLNTDVAVIFILLTTAYDGDMERYSHSFPLARGHCGVRI